MIALLYAGNGDLSEALITMDSARADLASIGTLESSQADLLAAIERAQTLSQAYLFIADIVRSRIAQQGIAQASQPADAVAARNALATLWLDNDGSSGWPGTLAAIDQLNDPEERRDQLNSGGVYKLSQARYFDEAETIARTYELAPDRNKALALVARALTSYDDYPESETVRFDFDKDGLPDFFSPASTQQERDALAVSLDDDIDGDGIANASDATPYCSVCEL